MATNKEMKARFDDYYMELLDEVVVEVSRERGGRYVSKNAAIQRCLDFFAEKRGLLRS